MGGLRKTVSRRLRGTLRPTAHPSWLETAVQIAAPGTKDLTLHRAPSPRAPRRVRMEAWPSSAPHPKTTTDTTALTSAGPLMEGSRPQTEPVTRRPRATVTSPPDVQRLLRL